MTFIKRDGLTFLKWGYMRFLCIVHTVDMVGTPPTYLQQLLFFSISLLQLLCDIGVLKG